MKFIPPPLRIRHNTKLIYLITIVTLLFTFKIYSQNEDTNMGAPGFARFHPNTGLPKSLHKLKTKTYNGNPKQIARKYLSENITTFGFKEGLPDLKVIDEKESHGIAHIAYDQVYKGLDVHGSTVVVTINTNSGTISSIINNYKPDIDVSTVPVIDKQTAKIIANTELNSSTKEKIKEKAELIIFENSSYKFVLCWRVVIETKDFEDNWLFIIDAITGEIYSKTETVLGFSGGGFTNGTGRVFSPDPATYNNKANPDATEIANAYKTVTLNDLYESSSNEFRLRGKYAWSADSSGATFLAVESDPDDFIYNYDEEGFEEVNIYYHIDAVRRYIGGLGFDPRWNNDAGTNTQAIVFDATQNSGSSVRYDQDKEYIQFYFRTNHIKDSGEDQSLATHEYGHALHDALISGGLTSSLNSDTQGISEGIASYVCISYRRLNTQNSYEINRLNNGPSLGFYTVYNENEKNYTDWTPWSSSYEKMQIWTSTLMQIEYTNATSTSTTRLGRAVTTKLALKSISYVTQYDDVLDNVYAFFDADRDLYSGAYADQLDYVFEDLREFPVPPQIPDRPSISGSVGNNPFISWTANSEADLDGYNLYRQINGGSYNLLVTLSKTTTSYTDNEVIISNDDNDPLINYAVSAIDDLNNESGKSVPRGIRSDLISKDLVSQERNGTVPGEFRLYEPYPNPFNPTTKISFDLPEDEHVKFTVYNSIGKQIKTLLNEVKTAGKHTIYFDGFELVSGVYFIMFQTSDFSAVKKLLLIK